MMPFANFVALRDMDDGSYELDFAVNGQVYTCQLTEDELDVICEIAEEFGI
jgi:hypothetical protein